VDAAVQFRVPAKDIRPSVVCVAAWNGAFGGVTDLYVRIDELEKIAAKLEGFPSQASETREFTLGALRENQSGGSIGMRFYRCQESRHGHVELKIASRKEAGEVQSVTLVFSIEAVSVDSFVKELRRIVSVGKENALLRGGVNEQ